MKLSSVSAAIPTYQREQVLIETVKSLIELEVAPAEILIVDQTPQHTKTTDRELALLERTGKIRWMRLASPSITHAMNMGLEQAQSDVVLFLDDDIIPGKNLIAAHARAQAQQGCNIVAGQVLQPGEEPLSEESNGAGFRFYSNRRQIISELMGGNFSIKRDTAIKLGGFDENFVQVAYRFEAEFAARALAAGEKILFEPEASIRHLKASTGGTRSYGEHLTTIKPSHAVGEYYYLLRAKNVRSRMLKTLGRPLRAIRTRHHLSHPWWIPATLIAETWGFVWAVALAARGPQLIGAGRTDDRRRRTAQG